MNKQPPQNIEAEESLLSAFLLHPDTIDRTLVPSDFYNQKNQLLFNVILNLYEDGRKIDMITVVEELKNDDNLHFISAAYIAKLTDEIPMSTNVTAHADIVKEKAKLRRMIFEANETINKCFEAEDINEIIDIHKDSIDKIQNRYTEEITINNIEKWISQAPGEFTVRDIDFDLSIQTQAQKSRRTKMLEELIKGGTLERSGKKRGYYRPRQNDLKEMDFMSADETPIDLWLPFHLHNAAKIMPGNIIQISGEKNSGKTALMLNIIKGNRNDFKVHYFNSEMGAQELKLRLGLFEDITLSMWNFDAYARSENFSDVIFPGEGNINIIDFLECHDEFYKMGEYMRQIHDKLDGAIAIVCIQKNKGAEKGLGGNRTEEKARLILQIMPGKLKIQMAKNWKSKDNPNNKCIDFKLVNGARLIQSGDWYTEV